MNLSKHSVSPAVSVVTVTLNNADGLQATLQSVVALTVRPLEILVIDGLSTDGTEAVVAHFDSMLPIRYVREADHGIYDAMNKGQRLARGQLLHYLNAGDLVWGEPYLDASSPRLLPTRIARADGQHFIDDFVKLLGYGYCHQGVLLPRGHAAYNAGLRVAADIEMLMQTFPRGLRTLPSSSAGGVTFRLGGVSSTRRADRDREILDAFARHKGHWFHAAAWMLIRGKALMPASVRRGLARVRGGTGR
jgi:glycosyltransferase involved in cell wall biosynthesis